MQPAPNAAAPTEVVLAEEFGFRACFFLCVLVDFTAADIPAFVVDVNTSSTVKSTRTGGRWCYGREIRRLLARSTTVENKCLGVLYVGGVLPSALGGPVEAWEPRPLT